MSDSEKLVDQHAPRLAQRTAEREAAFFLPYLRPGMSLLDCGCGPGTITIGLARAVAPGSVVGIDLHADRLDQARMAANQQGVANLRFEHGDIHALAYPNASFDVAFVHAVLEHLPDPVGALREVRRVLRPGGFVGVRSPEHGFSLIAPPDPLAIRLRDLYQRLREAKGLHPTVGRSLRAVVRSAGFGNVIGSATVEAHGTIEATSAFGEGVARVWGSPSVAGEIVSRGWATEAEVNQMLAAWPAWGQHPDAFIAATWCEAVGWLESA